MNLIFNVPLVSKVAFEPKAWKETENTADFYYLYSAHRNAFEYVKSSLKFFK